MGESVFTAHIKGKKEVEVLVVFQGVHPRADLFVGNITASIYSIRHRRKVTRYIYLEYILKHGAWVLAQCWIPVGPLLTSFWIEPTSSDPTYAHLK